MPKYGCDKRCPKVREQLREARKAGYKESDDEDSSSDPNVKESARLSTSYQRGKYEFPKSSKQNSSKYPSGAASPERIVGTPHRSHHTLSRDTPARNPDATREYNIDKRSYRRNKESERTNGHLLGYDGSPEASRRHEPEERSHRRRRESQRSKVYHENRVSPSTSVDQSRKFDPERRSEKQLRAANEHSEGRTRKADDGRTAGPSRQTRTKREEGQEGDDGESENDYPRCSKNTDDRCKPDCCGRNEVMEILKNEKQQEEFDLYLLYKNVPYFDNLCNCCYKCFANQLSKDSFVKSTAASIALFATGLALCWKLDGWTIPITS